MAPTEPSASPSPSRRFSSWQSAYAAVQKEADTATLFKLVEIAEAAIRTRRAALEGNPDHHAERNAMEEALADLLVVKRNRLKFDQQNFMD
jgi:hypothetical protein